MNSMSDKTLAALIWVLIYTGMAVFGLGAWFIEHSLAIGSTLMTLGAGAVIAGAVLIWLRSRRP